MRRSKNKTWFSFLLLISSIIIVASCTDKKSDNLSIQKVGELLFRRSYAAIQFRDVPEKELDSIENSNPGTYANSDTVLLKKLQEFGLVDEKYGLIISMFHSNGTKSFELNSDEKKIRCRIERPADQDKYDLYNLVAVNGNKRSKIEIEGHYGVLNGDIKYLLFDIIPGGYKEIVILNEYYIMNGDNSDLYIYEIKSN
ncbi:MAG: hypothetical protein HZB42_08950 [Sphingobacteriales bacterium]|nr:hypothetical protein [Sphingobacteriales bacterium]